MADNDYEVVVLGGGAAGIAAARRLHDAGVRCLLVEARGRLETARRLRAIIGAGVPATKCSHSRSV